jgi:hypothetical protein
VLLIDISFCQLSLSENISTTLAPKVEQATEDCTGSRVQNLAVIGD